MGGGNPYPEERTTEEEAGLALAKLMGSKLKLEVDAYALRKFIKDNWWRVNQLAHIIHNGSPT